MNKKLHILFLCSWFPSRVRPTSGDFVLRHAEAVSRIHKVTVAHVITDATLQHKLELKIDYHLGIKVILVYVKKSKNPLRKIQYFLEAFSLVFKEVGKFDLTHLNVTYPKGIVALYLKFFKNIPYLITEHWTGYLDDRKNKISNTRLFITKIIVKNASLICPVNQTLEKSMINKGISGKYLTVSNVVDDSFFEGELNPKVNKRFTLTHISHMGDEHKNVSGIIKTIARLNNQISNLHFNLIGENSEQFRVLLEELRINSFDIIDQIPNKEIGEYLRNSNVFVLFSNYENQPCVILESFASGTPVISTNVGGISEHFPADFGYLIPPNNMNALKRHILKIYHSELNFDSNTMRAYAYKNFSYSAIAKKYSDLYFEILQ